MFNRQATCYGFFHTKDQLPGAVWTTEVAHPFKPRWLWLWGDNWGPKDKRTAVVQSLCVALDEHLVQPMPFVYMQRPITIESFLAFIDPVALANAQQAGGSMLINGARCSEALCRDNGAPGIEMRVAELGEQLSLRASGNIRGFFLVGWSLVATPAPAADPEQPV